MGLLASASYIDVVLLLLIIFAFGTGLVLQRKVRQKIEEMGEGIIALRKYQGDTFQSSDKEYASLQKAFSDKTDWLTANPEPWVFITLLRHHVSLIASGGHDYLENHAVEGAKGALNVSETPLRN